jgi:anaerobic magnesium-protoporphyrin IX monomethyl ester cyclase
MVESNTPNSPSPKIRRFNKVLLISLPSVKAADDVNPYKENVMHLGLAYLAAILREHNYAVKILDCYAEDMLNKREPADGNWIEYGLSDEQIIGYVSHYLPDLIGISIPFSCQHYVGHRIARLIKQLNPNIPIVSGGNHVTAASEKIGADCFDYLIMGEGEYSFLHLLDELNNYGETDHIARIYPNGNRNPDHIMNLDDLPFPALDLMPLSKLWYSRPRWINMVATRGCIFNCIFCSIHTIMGYTIRRRSVENVISEIMKWKHEYRIQEVYFEDDNLTANRRWAKDLFQRIADLKLGIRFHVRNGIRADMVDRELLSLMRKAGFQDFMISPESGSQRTLDVIIGKKAKLEDYENAIRLAQEIGLGVNTFFVLGFPDETWEDLDITIKYARHLKELGAVGFSFSTATPFPGTRLYAECIERGLIDPDHFDYRRLRTIDYVINHPIFSNEELLAYQSKVMEEFSPPKLSVFGKTMKRISLLIRDPAMFYTKLRFKLNFLFFRLSQPLSRHL